jgi:glutathione S-transferase
MQLHLINGSPNGRKVLSVAHHLGLDIEPVWIDLFAGENMAEEYLALNPNGQTPTLVDGDFVLWESNAINLYLCTKSENQSLYPADYKRQADINRWLSWELAHYNRALGIIAFQAVAKPAFGLGEPNQALVDHFVEQFDRYGAVLNNHLAERDFVVGNDWTIADYALGHIEMFQEAMPIDWSKFKHLVRFYERIRNNPHWAASAAASPNEIGRVPTDT